MRLWLLLAGLSAVLIGAALWYTLLYRNTETQFSAAGAFIQQMDSSALAPANIRVRVRVLNGTKTSGLARRATQRLRDHRYDVVDYATAQTPSAETIVEVGAESRSIGERVVRALGGGTVREVDKPPAHTDVLVILGNDWQPPPQPFRP